NRSSCALPVALEPGIGHEQLLDSNFGIVEGYFDFEIAAAAGEPADGSTAEPAMAHSLSLHVPRCVLAGFLGCLCRGYTRWRRFLSPSAPFCGLTLTGLPATPARRPQRIGALLFDYRRRQ